MTAADNTWLRLYQAEYGTIAVVAGSTAGDWAVGEDVTQEAFARAHREWDRISTYDKPGAWVRRVAINLALNHVRSRTRERKAVEHLAATTVDPESPVELRGIWKAVAELPPAQRAVVALHYHEGLSTSEIAELTETSVSAVTTSLHKARTRLASMIGDNR